MSDNLYFTDLPIGVTEDQFREVMSPYGTIRSLKLLVKPGLKPHALIRYGSADEAAWIVQNLNGNIPQGLTEPIQVRYAQQGGKGGKDGWGAGMDAWGGMGGMGGMDAWAGMGGMGGMGGMDAWGGGMDAWGPCKGGWKGAASGPYGKGGGQVGWQGGYSMSSYSPPLAPDSMPEVTWLEVDATSKLVQAGYPSKGCAIEHSKLDVFSESHYWCQEFFSEMLKEACNFEHDSEATLHPEVYQAWKAAGKADNMQLVVTCPKFGVWAVGFGGKKNAERAAKLALATVLAQVVDPSQTAAVIGNYPAFGQYLEKINTT